MNEQSEIINRLTFENYIWAIYIIISIGNIIGDELIKDSITEHNQKKDSLAKNIFTISLIITIIIYLYFLDRNYKDYQSHHNTTYEIRLIGSLLMFAGILCFLYFQIKTTTTNDTVSSI